MTYVFPHIPKCGGTSLLKHFENKQLKVLADYRFWAEKLSDEEAVRDYSGYDLIYGHFPVDRYERPEHHYIALVRDPVERAFSAYLFHRDEYLRTKRTVYFRTKRPVELYDRIGMWIARGEMSFLEFVNMAPGVKLVYQRLMKCWPKERFELVGTTERYDEFLEGLSRLLGVEFKNTIRERKAKRDIELADEERRRARNLLADEYRWYNQFVR